MILRTLAINLLISILFCPQTNAQSKQRYQSEKLHKRYEEEVKKDLEESKKEQPTTVIDIPKVTFLLPGLSYEKAIGKFQTIQAYALYNLYSYSRSSGGNVNSSYYFDPTMMLSYRLYVNHDRRVKLGKVTERNTMNYVSPFAQVFFSKTPIGSNGYENEQRRAVYMYGALYGLQRNYKSHFSFDLNFGLGVVSGQSWYYNSSTGAIASGNRIQATLPGQITLGFWFGKTKTTPKEIVDK